MKSVGIPDRDIVLYGNKLIKKAKKHRYNFQDIRDLPKLLITPICIFGGSYDGSFAILTEMIVNGKRSIVSIDINKGEVQDVNLVTSIYDKRNESIIRWIIIPTDFLLSPFFVVHVTICKNARNRCEIGRFVYIFMYKFRRSLKNNVYCGERGEPDLILPKYVRNDITLSM